MSKKDKTTKDFDFFLSANLDRYKGEYVAIVSNKVAAHGINAKEVWNQARQKFPKVLPTIAKLPREEVLILQWKN